MATAKNTAIPRQTKKQADAVINNALQILEQRMRKPGYAIASPFAVRAYLTLQMAELEHEVFGIIWLDNQHRVIDCEQLFRGTIHEASVYPREVVKSALWHNAAAAIFFHNHPSGVAEPSRSDVSITSTLVEALNMVEVRSLDHIIVGIEGCSSMMEAGAFPYRQDYVPAPKPTKRRVPAKKRVTKTMVASKSVKK